MMAINDCTWLVVSTILKNISQWEGLSHILWKNVPNHQSDTILINGGMNSCCIHDTITGHRRFTNLTSYRDCICWALTLSNVLGEWMLDVAASSYLVGGYYSQYMAVSWDDYSQYMGSHNPVIFQTTNQITIILLIFPLLLVYTLWKPLLISHNITIFQTTNQIWFHTWDLDTPQILIRDLRDLGRFGVTTEWVWPQILKNP